jgi:hypothetical protein
MKILLEKNTKSTTNYTIQHVNHTHQNQQQFNNAQIK